MPRRPGPWYRAARDMFFALLQGKQVPLGVSGPDTPEQRQLAEAAFRALTLTSHPVVQAGPSASPPRTVAQAVADYLADRRGRVSAEWARQLDFTLRVHLAAAFGPRPVAALTARELEDWAADPPTAKKPWSDTTRHNRLGTVSEFLAWCGHPLKIARPPAESRGADVALTDEQFERVLAAYDESYGGDFAQLLRALRATGARQQEIAPLTVGAVDWGNGCVVLRRHKTRRKTGRDRVIHLNADARAVFDAQRAKYGTGFLFRTRAGRAYRPKMVVQQMGRLSKRAGFRAIAHGERHGFATRALAAGVPDAVVAELLGHTSTAMVSRVYGHLGQRSRELKAAAERVAGKAG